MAGQRAAGSSVDITCTLGVETGKVLRREPTVCDITERHFAHEHGTAAVGLFQSDCPFYDWMLAGLNERSDPDGLPTPALVQHQCPS